MGRVSAGFRRRMMWALLLVALLLVVLCSMGRMTVEHAMGWGMVACGLGQVLLVYLDFSRPRWAGIAWGLGFVLWGVGGISDNMILYGVGVVIAAAGFLRSILGRQAASSCQSHRSRRS